MSKLALVILMVACQPLPAATVAPATEATSSEGATEAHGDSCQRDIPDCSAACSLRETNHLEFIDWYDRRCAAVILGKNPDKVAGKEPPQSTDASADPTHTTAPPRTDDLSDNPYR